VGVVAGAWALEGTSGSLLLKSDPGIGTLYLIARCMVQGAEHVSMDAIAGPLEPPARELNVLER
jgi:hypothetical protein